MDGAIQPESATKKRLPKQPLCEEIAAFGGDA